jgi:hypothetical protein
MFLGSNPVTPVGLFPVVCQCSGDIDVCGWYSFTTICPDNVVIAGGGLFPPYAKEAAATSGVYEIMGPAESNFGDSWVYIYWKAEVDTPVNIPYTYLKGYQEDPSFPFFNVTASIPDPSSPDYVPLGDFTTLDGSIPYNPDPTEEGFESNGVLTFNVPAGHYYFFGIYKRGGESNPFVPPSGASLYVGPELPSCAVTDGVIMAQAVTSDLQTTHFQKNKREKKTKRAKRTRPPTKMSINKPSHA